MSVAAFLLILLITSTQPNIASVVEKPSSIDASATIEIDAPGSNHSSLVSIAESTLKRHFGLAFTNLSLSEFADSFAVPPMYRKRAGVFVTFSKNGKTRACWGSLNPTFENLAKATVFTTEQALTDEYRYTKITASEIESLKVQVTVVKRTEPLNNLSEQNPRTCGMIVRSGGKSGVILPGECTDAYYQLVQCKLKAGIKKNEPCQIYRIKADVYR
jgi:AMMECR1 domain-containing protein